MAGTSLLALLDDIATILDDVAVLAKVAAKKTAGVLGDDLALNAEQVCGIRAERELPVVWAVAKGSFRNKLILVPVALLASALAPWTITPLLMAGGVYLCFEGFEKLADKYLHGPDETESGHKKKVLALLDPDIDLVAYEQEKIRGAIRTDFILSAEIIVIALGTVQGAAMMTQVTVVSAVALLMTVGVYALVAGIVKLDDMGLHLVGSAAQGGAGRGRQMVGKMLLQAAPLLMKFLAVAGTVAMFLVGGGILVHGLPVVRHLPERCAELLHGLPLAGGLLAVIVPPLLNVLVGIVAGGLVLAAVGLGKNLAGRVSGKA